MKKVFLLISLFAALQGFAQETAKQVYESPKMKETIARHKVVAILPFVANITYKRPPKNFDESANKAEEASLGSSLQNEMYTYLLRKRSNYSVDFQDVDKTNALLKKAGIFDKLDEVTADSVAKVLGVDAVIKCNYSYQKTSSEGAAIAKTILFGGIGSKTASGLLVMQVKNGKDGELLWRFSKTMDETAFSSASQLMERMMRKISRNFPYEK
ncbi:MAG: hypothetical protein KGO81_12075 [Bacteroidota bacterium]|nr:hypothetical protein [Bacteroidota bacterium]